MTRISYEERLRRTRIGALNDYPDKKQALTELTRLSNGGFCNATPPIMGLLMQIGYFMDRTVLKDAIEHLNSIIE